MAQQQWFVGQLGTMRTEIKNELREELKADIKMINDKVDFFLANQGKGKGKGFAPSVDRSGSWGPQSQNEVDKREELISRTVIYGGVPKDTKREVIEKKVEELIEGVDGIEGKPYTLSIRATIGFLRFSSKELKTDYLKSIRGKEKPSFGDKQLFIGPERSSADRRKARPLTKVKFMLTEKGLNRDLIEIDFRMGVLWVDGVDTRVAEWQWTDPGSDDNAAIFKVNKSAIDGLPIDLTGEQVEQEVVKLTRRL